MEQTSQNLRLKKRVMRRVYLVYAIRHALHPTTLKILIAVVFFARSTKYVSYSHVLTNMLSSFSGLSSEYQFTKAAMFHAHPMALVLLSSVAWLSVWVAYDLFSRNREEAWF